MLRRPINNALRLFGPHMRAYVYVYETVKNERTGTTRGRASANKVSGSSRVGIALCCKLKAKVGDGYRHA